VTLTVAGRASNRATWLARQSAPKPVTRRSMSLVKSGAGWSARSAASRTAFARPYQLVRLQKPVIRHKNIQHP
jgi:hypothetical protein